MIMPTIEVLTALQTGPCTFVYHKMSGEIRVAIGTLNPTYIPEGVVKHTIQDSNPGVIRYFDLGTKAWRSFHVENLQSLSF